MSNASNTVPTWFEWYDHVNFPLARGAARTKINQCLMLIATGQNNMRERREGADLLHRVNNRLKDTKIR